MNARSAVGLVLLASLARCASSPTPPMTHPMPTGGYAAFAHYGTNPVIDSDERARVVVGLSSDRAAWMILRHYLALGEAPPAEAVRVEDCIAAMAPASSARVGLREVAAAWVTTSLGASPFRDGWQTLLVTVTAMPRDRDVDGRFPTEPAVVVLSDRGDGVLERALVAHGARLFAGGLDALPGALEQAERLVVVSSGAGFGGVGEQAGLLDAVARARAHGTIVSVVGRIEAGLDDALLDRIAELGGGLYDALVPGEEASLARRMLAPIGLAGVVVSLTLDATRVMRWRLVGHEGRSAHVDAELVPRGGIVLAGESLDLLLELKPSAPISGEPLGTLRVSGDDGVVIERELLPTRADARHQAIVVIAALAEKLRGSFWMKDLAWDRLSDAIAALPSPALRDELADVVARARRHAVMNDPMDGERPIHVTRRLPDATTARP